MSRTLPLLLLLVLLVGGPLRAVPPDEMILPTAALRFENGVLLALVHLKGEGDLVRRRVGIAYYVRDPKFHTWQLQRDFGTNGFQPIDPHDEVLVLGTLPSPTLFESQILDLKRVNDRLFLIRRAMNEEGVPVWTLDHYDLSRREVVRSETIFHAPMGLERQTIWDAAFALDPLHDDKSMVDFALLGATISVRKESTWLRLGRGGMTAPHILSTHSLQGGFLSRMPAIGADTERNLGAFCGQFPGACHFIQTYSRPPHQLGFTYERQFNRSLLHSYTVHAGMHDVVLQDAVGQVFWCHRRGARPGSLASLNLSPIGSVALQQQAAGTPAEPFHATFEIPFEENVLCERTSHSEASTVGWLYRTFERDSGVMSAAPPVKDFALPPDFHVQTAARTQIWKNRPTDRMAFLGVGIMAPRDETLHTLVTQGGNTPRELRGIACLSVLAAAHEQTLDLPPFD